ncbi:uncharacterized protein E0L32_012022 [Thyridium curvatum]|uniref:Pheromone-regulated membrane protein n=1 Tax=Thyridium curvatum TaxID=1093900 RepID=A0A507BJU3_9PEZI|nr:uncharacterized protein E0L32_012022 [Thyridium curvatum]TPX17669.1 hypothetical protein E0L32_012022 [Thyridium curvatum]
MGFLSHSRKNEEVRPEQKWDYISINDFKSTSCFTPFAYGYLYFMLLISIAVYAVDTFTAINLLVFDRWSSEIDPTQLIPRTVSKWIFSICIILSVVNLVYEHIRAQRVMRRGSVAECYLDNLAVRLESIRMGKGRGWKRFLVFAELTKSKKGAEYVALFTYFSFQSWVRVVICSGPRQAVNALTLLSVYNAKISAHGETFEGTLLDFFDKIRALAEQDYRQALILSGMCFTLVIWVFSALSLLLAVLFFIFFLWGYIPREDGGLTGFCSRKINKRLMTIVSAKVNKAIAEEERKRQKAELKAAKKAGELPPMELKATIPNVSVDSLPQMPTLSRNDTMNSLSGQSAPPLVSAASFELGSMDQKRPAPSRSGTMASTASSFSSRAPLLGHAAEFGSGRASPAPSIPAIPDLGALPPPTRTGTAASNRSFGAPPSQLSRNNTNGSGFGAGYTASPATYSSDTMPPMPSMPQPMRSPAGGPGGYSRPPFANHSSNLSGSSIRFNQDDYSSTGRASPAPSMGSYRSGPTSPRGYGPANGAPYPVRSATGPMPGPRGPGQQYPQRNMTAPVHQQQPSNGSFNSFNDMPSPSSQRGPAPSRPGFGSGWNTDIESQRGPGRY